MLTSESYPGRHHDDSGDWGEELRELRKASGLTFDTWVACLGGIKAQTLRCYESGHGKPRQAMMERARRLSEEAEAWVDAHRY